MKNVVTTGTAVAGTRLTIKADFANNGVGDTYPNAYYARVMLRPSNGGYATHAGTIVMPNLAAGETQTNTFVVTVPGTLAPGGYQLTVEADSGGHQVESNEANNTSAPVNVVMKRLLPDLSIRSITGPDTVRADRPLVIKWTVANTGDSGIDFEENDVVYLTRNGEIDTEAVRLSPVATHAAPGPKSNVTIARSFDLPASAGGNYQIVIVADGDNRVAESNEANNAGRAAVSVTPITAPDLTVPVVIAPTVGYTGRQIPVGWIVTNTGGPIETKPGDSTPSWTDTVYLSADAGYNAGDVLLGRVLHQGTVAAKGGRYTETLKADLPGLTPGDYHLILRSDILNHVPESNEANNIKASVDRINVDADVLALPGTRTGTLREGRAVYYKIVVSGANAGQTLRLTLDAADADAANELYVAYDRMPSRSAFDVRNTEAAEADVSAVVPTAKAGTYYVLAYGGGLGTNGSTAYTLSADTVAFGVKSTNAPAGVANTGRVTLRLNGVLFDGKTAFALVGPGGHVIGSTRVSLRSAATAFATFDLTDAPAGQYGVRATRTYGGQPITATLANAFTVTAGLPAGNSGGYTIDVNAPASVRNRFPITVTWGNDTARDLPAPLILVSSDLDLPISLDPALAVGQHGFGELMFLGASPTGCSGTLGAGQQHTATIYSGTQPGSRAHFRTYVIPVNDTRPMNFEYVRAALPAGVLTAADFATLWPKLKAAIGTTWGHFTESLGNLADVLPAIAGDARDVGDLLNLLVRRVRAESGRGLFGRASSDDSGIDLSNRRVTATNTDTGESFVTRTLADGSFAFENVTEGDYTFAVENAIVAAATNTAVTGSGPHTGTTLGVVAGATWSGTVRNAAGRAVAGANVRITAVDGRTMTAVTDAVGRYAFDGVSGGTYSLATDADGYARGRVDAVDVNAVDVSRNLTLVPQATLVGTLPAGGGTAAYHVTAVRQGVGDAHDADVYTLATAGGAFTLGGLPAGTYAVTVDRRGFAPATQTVTLAAVQQGTLGAVPLAPGATIEGSVADATNKPTVGLFDAAGAMLASTVADASGRYAFADLAAGTYTLKLIHAGRFATTPTVTIAAGQAVTDATITPLPGGGVYGVARDATGQVLAGLPVVMVDANGTRRRTFTRDNGRYRFDALPAGDYVVAVPGSGVLATVKIDPQNGDGVADLTLASAATISGFALAATGSPLAGTLVQLLADGRPVATAQADASGGYGFVVLTPGTYTITAQSEAGSFADVTGVVVITGGHVTQTLRAGSGSARVTVDSDAAATVLLYRQNADGTATLAGRTQADGSATAEFKNLSAGTYAVRIYGENTADWLRLWSPRALSRPQPLRPPYCTLSAAASAGAAGRSPVPACCCSTRRRTGCA